MCQRCCFCSSSGHRRKPPAVSGIRVNTDINVNNIIVILGDSRLAGIPISFGVNGKTLDITTDEIGNTLLNGMKMDENALPDGTKVFLFKNKQMESHSE